MPKIEKISECLSRRGTINITISDLCSQASDAEKVRFEIRTTISFVVPESTLDSIRTKNNKYGSVAVTCRYKSSPRDSMKK